MTQKEAFFKYLCLMDVEMLNIILTDNISYFGVSKEVFLEKLAFLFSQVQLGVDYDNLKIKQHKKKPNTYYLLFNNYHYASKFILEDHNGLITNIYNPRVIKNKEEVEWLSAFELFFGDDEKVDFKPTNDYLMNVYRCNAIYESFENNKINIFTSQDLAAWIESHYDLYYNIKDDYLMFKYNDFKSLYASLEYV